ncbi:MAG: hypothetical protein K2V38_22625 [Gemmataceae bacterium]|nr:hypothetical protein [Gemmataceae bacterium]
MHARFLLFVVGLGVLPVTGGCFPPADVAPPPRATAPAAGPKGWGLPVAPMPHAKKTMAELLVGKWQTTVSRGRQLAPMVEIILEFQKNGEFVFTITDPKNGFQMNAGTFAVDGSVVHLTSATNVDSDGKAICWSIDIESISEKEMVTIAGPADDREKSICERRK